MKRWAASLRLALFLTLAGCIFGALPANARNTERASGLPTILLSELPPEAKHTLERIRRGGPFPYPQKDGSVFGNYERHLPVQPRGYYREYTVPTPGSPHRGARRIVAGQGPGSQGAATEEYYYTADHYRSFYRIAAQP